MPGRDELRARLLDTFRAELDEHVQTLSAGLLRLRQELSPAERQQVREELARAAHSLKGAARAVDERRVEQLAHQLEDGLAGLPAAAPPHDDDLDQLLRATDHLRDPLPATGDPGAAPRVSAAIEVAPPGAAVAGDTVRVSTASLDELLQRIDELVVALQQGEQQVAGLRSLQTLVLRRQREQYQRPEAAADALLAELLEPINRVHRQFALHHQRAGLLVGELQETARRVRMQPLATLFQLLPRMVHDLARQHGKEVTLETSGEQVTVDRRVLEELKDALIQLIRNAVDHGLEQPHERLAAGKSATGRLSVKAELAGRVVRVEVGDDGGGVDLDRVRQVALERQVLSAEELAALSDRDVAQLIFHPALSTRAKVSDVSGRGVGLDVVRQAVGRLQGSLQVASVGGAGTTFTLTLPVTVGTAQVLLLQVRQQVVALPALVVDRVLRTAGSALTTVSGHTVVEVDEARLPVALAADLLQPSAAAGDRPAAIVVLRAGAHQMGLWVDAVLSTTEVVTKPLEPPLDQAELYSGAAILGSGQVVLVLNPTALGAAVQQRRALATLTAAPRRRVLVVDDSLTARSLHRSMLESVGFEVMTAADGAEAWSLLQRDTPDAVVTDLEMPHMDGLSLVKAIRAEARLLSLPVILISSHDTPTDQQRGLEAGADAYLGKADLAEASLLDAMRHLLGWPP